MSQLQQQFEHEMEIPWRNSQGEPDIDYVNWLEAKVEKFTSTNSDCAKCADDILLLDLADSVINKRGVLVAILKRHFA